MPPLFAIKNVSKNFGERAVLKDISLTVERGEVVAIIGPSGSGKSTLLRCATLLETMDSGTLELDGITAVRNDAAGKSVYASPKTLHQYRLKTGLVFQNFNLFPHYTVLKNVVEPQVLVHRRDPREAEAEAKRLLAKMGLADHENAYPCELSGGQQQRVSIARALAMSPEILFFDEPTSALDPLLTGEVLAIIRALAEQNKTMVIVTHEIEFARRVADRVVFITDGYVVEEGASDEVICSPRNAQTQAFLRKSGL